GPGSTRTTVRLTVGRSAAESTPVQSVPATGPTTCPAACPTSPETESGIGLITSEWSDGAESGAAKVSDPDLAGIISTWSTLPEPIRRAVLALFNSTVPLTTRLPRPDEP